MSAVDTTAIVQAIVNAEGNIDLAAERLKMTRDLVIDALTRDDESMPILTKKMGVLLQVQTFDLLMHAHRCMIGNMDEIPADKIGQTYASLLQSYTALTNKGETIARSDVVSVVEQMAQERGLPPESAGQAVRYAEKILRGIG